MASGETSIDMLDPSFELLLYVFSGN